MFTIQTSSYSIENSYWKGSYNAIVQNKQLSISKIETLFIIPLFILKFDKGTCILFQYNGAP